MAQALRRPDQKPQARTTSVAPRRAPWWLRRSWAPVAAVAAVALLASVAGLFNAFAYDDVHLIQENGRLHSLGNWRVLLTSPFWPAPFSQDLYRPVTSLLLAIQYALGGGDPVVYRLVSYLLYAAVAVGLLVLLRRWLPVGPALAAALFFAAHPVHVEAVALGVGQGELVVALLGVLMVLRYVDRRRAGGLRWGDWGTLGLLYVLASLTKEQGLVLPGLLLAVEALLPEGDPPARWRRAAPGYAFLAGLGLLLLLLRREALGGDVTGTFTAEALEGLGAGGRALTMLPVLLEWARLLIWPAHLQADYSPQEMAASTRVGVAQAAGLVVLLGGFATAWWARRRTPVLALGLAWCGVALFPVSNVLVPTGILLAERTLFLPSLGFLIAVAGVLAGAAGATPDPDRARRNRRIWMVALPTLVLAGVLRSAERQRVWRNEAFFSVRTVQDAPRSYRAQRAYGEVLFELEQWQLAIEAYRQALELAPPGHAWRVRNDLARRFRALGAAEPEVEQLQASLIERPDQEDARGHLIAAYLVLGRYKEAVAAADTALSSGATPEVFRGLRAVADSAARVGAPAGSVRIGITAAPSRGARSVR